MASLQAQNTALQAELRLKELQIARLSPPGSAVGTKCLNQGPCPKRPGTPASQGALTTPDSSHCGLVGLRAYPRAGERDFEVASTVVGSSEDDSTSQNGFDAVSS